MIRIELANLISARGAMKDFFVSYNRYDQAWAEWIAWILEAAGYTLIIQAWDFRAGGNFVLDMQRSAIEAKKTIAILSQNYLNSLFTQPEWAAAFAQDPTSINRKLIPIRIAECELSGILAQIVYVDLVGVEEAAAQELVLRSLREGRSKPEQKSPFPGQFHAATDQKPSFPAQIPHNLPYSGAIAFVGREQELETLHELLQRENSVSISAIAGMGGIGKTELALQYARKHCRERVYLGGVCWLRAREEVGTQIISFARSCLELTPPDDLELAEKVRWCWKRWREGATLLILDDVQKYEDVESFLPPQDSQFKVLMTTRSRFGSPVQELPLDVLSPEKALELLRALVQDERVDRELERSEELCEWLGYLPLGVELVGRYLAKKQDVSIELLWQRLQEKRLEARAFKQAEPGMTASLGVAAAFELSWQSLDESAQQLATVLSLFALVEIPWRLVEQCLPEVDAEELEEIRDQVLLRANLLKRVDQGMYQLHQLLREFFASKREKRTDVEELKRKFYEAVIAEAKRVFEKPERSLLKESALTITHLEQISQILKRQNQDVDLAVCLFWIARLHWRQGQYDEAETPGLQSLELRQQLFGNNHPDTAQSLSDLSVLRTSQERNDEAETIALEALGLRQCLFDNDHPDVAQSLNNLANVFIRQQRFVEAEQLLLQANKLWKRQLGDNHPDLAVGLKNLGQVYIFQQRYSEAEQILLQASEIWKCNLGNNNPFLARTLSDLGFLRLRQERYSDAECFYYQCLKIFQHHLPNDHPDTAKIVNHLAKLYYLQGHYSNAESLYLQALSTTLRKLGEDHPSTQKFRENFRSLLQKALEENRTDELSNDRMTRSLLQELQNSSE